MSMTFPALELVATVVLAPYRSDFATETASTTTTTVSFLLRQPLRGARAPTGMGVLGPA